MQNAYWLGFLRGDRLPVIIGEIPERAAPRQLRHAARLLVRQRLAGCTGTDRDRPQICVKWVVKKGVSGRS